MKTPSRQHASQPAARRSDHGFTLIELLVVISVLSLLMALLLPALAQARESSLATKCLANQRGVGQVQTFYLADYSDTLPGAMFRDRNDTAVVWYQTFWGGSQVTPNAYYIGGAMSTAQADRDREALILQCTKNTGLVRSHSVYGQYSPQGGTYYAGTTYVDSRFIKRFTFPGNTGGPSPFIFLKQCFDPARFVIIGCSSGYNGSNPAKPVTQGYYQFTPASIWSDSSAQNQGLWLTHNDAANMLFLDGHALRMNPDMIRSVPNFQKITTPSFTGIRAWKWEDGTEIVYP